MGLSFNAWKNDADIPTQAQDGSWYDAETGISFARAATKTRVSVSPKAKVARESAKFFGGKALTGTAKQKEWAEKIRAEKLSNMSPADALIVAADSLAAQSKLWIDNRNKYASEFIAYAIKKAALSAAHKAARAENDAASVKSTADAYNALTAQWGYV